MSKTFFFIKCVTYPNIKSVSRKSLNTQNLKTFFFFFQRTDKMGLPIWKPKRSSLDEIQEDICKRRRPFRTRNIEQLSPTERISVIIRHSNNNEPVTNESNSYEMRRNRLLRRQNLLTSSFTERQQSSSSIYGSPSHGDEVEQRAEQFIWEKRDLLDQLQETTLLLEHYLSEITLSESDTEDVSEFITQGSQFRQQ